MADASDAPAGPQAKNVVYCAVCTFPPEYCEFGPTVAECRKWLEANHPSLASKIYSGSVEIAPAVNPDTETKAAAAQEKLERKHAAAAAKNAEKAAAARIVITEIERSKRKHVTVVNGLEEFGLDLKKMAKEFGKKFATGSSVTKKPSGGEEITIQGEVGDDLKDWLVEKQKLDGKQISVEQGKKNKGSG